MVASRTQNTHTYVYSTGVDTPLSFDYGDGDWANDPTVTMGDGDGTGDEVTNVVAALKATKIATLGGHREPPRGDP